MLNRIAWIACAAMIVSLGGIARAGDEPSLDQLLKIPDAKPAPKPDSAAKPAHPADHPAATGDAGDHQVETAEANGGDDFQKAIADMTVAADRLGDQHDAGLDTQRAQQRAVARLDQLISKLQKQKKSSGKNKGKPQQQDTGSQKNQSAGAQQGAPGGTQAMQDSQATHGTVQNGQLNNEPLAQHLSEWGNLPPRLRDQLLQGLEDRFSNLYKQMTEKYYQRLGEQGNE